MPSTTAHRGPLLLLLLIETQRTSQHLCMFCGFTGASGPLLSSSLAAATIRVRRRHSYSYSVEVPGLELRLAATHAGNLSM